MTACNPGGTMRRHFTLPYLVSLLLAVLPGVAQALAQIASPPFNEFQPDIDVDPQNFAVARDHRGVVYVGNADGVLEFDGERWALIRVANGEIVRSMAHGDGRIYVGGYDAFGYLELMPDGRREYRGLDHLFDGVLEGRRFADIWDTVVAPEGVYFRALRDVFLWNPADGATTHWHHPGRFGVLLHDRGRTLLQFRGEGLKRRSAGAWTLVPGSAHLVDLVPEMVPLQNGELLAIASEGTWWRVGQNSVVEQAMPPELGSATRFEHGAAHADGSIALASGDGVLHVLDPDLGSSRSVRLESGFLADVSAHEGGFLVVGSEALYQVQWPSALRVVGAEHGLSGSVLGVARWRGTDHVLTSGGGFRLAEAGTGAALSPVVAWPATAYHDLLELDEGRALLAGQRLLWADESGVQPLVEELVYPRQFFRSRFEPQRVFVATEDGVRVLDTGGSVPRIDRAHEALRDVRATDIVERSPDEIWVATYRHGILRMRFDPDLQNPQVTPLGPESGIEYGQVMRSSLVEFDDGRVVASTSVGLFVWEDGMFRRDGLEGLEALRGDAEFLQLVATGTERWAYNASRLLRGHDEGGWEEFPVRPLRRGGLTDHRIDDQGRVRFLAERALVLFDPDARRQEAGRPGVLLRSVQRIGGDAGAQGLPLRPAEVPTMTAGEFGLAFRFALPDLDRAGRRSYRGRLLGYESHFSNWSPSAGYTYWRLRPGHYRLEVEARDAAGLVSAIEPYVFVIEPRWFQTVWAWVGGSGLLVVALYLVLRRIVRLRTDRLRADTERLERIVLDRTDALAAANRRLERMAHLDGLTGIGNRRRLDLHLDEAWRRCATRGRPLGLIMIDVDHFKAYNDRHGHLAGDELLRRLAPLLEGCLRRSEDLLARYGGEEFLAVMPGADAAVVADMAETMKRAVASASLGVTVSIGAVSSVPEPGLAVDALLERVDEALYRAKHKGRDRIEGDVSD